EATRAGNAVDAGALSRAIGGVAVVETVASKGAGIEALATAAAKATGAPPRSALPRPKAAGPGAEGDEIGARHRWAADVMRSLELRLPVTPRPKSDRIDRILLHPVFGSIIFLLVMGCMFQAVFSWAQPLMDGIDGFVAWLQQAVKD